MERGKFLVTRYNIKANGAAKEKQCEAVVALLLCLPRPAKQQPQTEQ